MRSTVVFACAAALSVAVVGVAQAQDHTWDGGGDGTNWTDPLNWNTDVVPNGPVDGVFLGTNNITVGAAANINLTAGTGGFATIFGPDWGGTLNVEGTLAYQWYLAPVADEILDPTSTINVTGNGSLTGEGIGLGFTWWINTAPNAALNMADNATVTINWLWWGGQVNLDGGTLTINGGVNSATEGDVSDATRLMDIGLDGTLVLGYATGATDVADWITRGILTANGGAGTFVIDTVSQPGQTIVTVIPEPASLGLLGLGVLAIAARRRA